MDSHFRYVIGIDMDGVLANYESFLRRVTADELGIDEESIPLSESWNFTNWPIRDRDHYEELHLKEVSEYSMFANLDEIPGASDALWRLNDHDELRFRIVTHRYPVFSSAERKKAVGLLQAKITADTVAWLQQIRPDGRPLIPFHDLAILGTSKADKASVGCDIYIDDSPGNIAALRSEGQRAIVFSQEYNSHIPGLRADNWEAVEAIILEELEEQRFLRNHA